jgi:hypothetical protein
VNVRTDATECAGVKRREGRGGRGAKVEETEKIFVRNKSRGGWCVGLCSGEVDGSNIVGTDCNDKATRQ